jgi:NADP-dependent 3-hydroxy acid dehydrogenase YdfG
MTPRTWLITGVNSGFGRHMTEQLLARGDRVAGTVRKLDAMNDLKAEYGDRLWPAHLDVTDTPAFRSVVDRAFDHRTSPPPSRRWMPGTTMRRRSLQYFGARSDFYN